MNEYMNIGNVCMLCAGVFLRVSACIRLCQLYTPLE